MILVCITLRFFYDGGRPSPLDVTFIGLTFALNTFAACWFCLARHWIRFPITLIAISMIGILFGTVEGPPNQFEWSLFLMPFVVSLPIVITLELTKKYFGTFRRLGSTDNDGFREGLQFNIRQLIILTTMIAVGFGVWNAFRDSIAEYVSSESNVRHLAIDSDYLCNDFAVYDCVGLGAAGTFQTLSLTNWHYTDRSCDLLRVQHGPVSRCMDFHVPDFLDRASHPVAALAFRGFSILSNAILRDTNDYCCAILSRIRS